MSQVSNSASENYAAWVGIDWADEQHAVALQAAGSDAVEQTPPGPNSRSD